ncbi:MAG TPA: NAD-dependent epimerase/dehydratase family protein [Candidatus Bathyarchaeia archaeon]|nr:NAD-dependent epimerase/dehydratase family protein [Candidatus Bathyarchaeia archaeon]
MKRVLVTGGGGFIGSHLAKHLRDRGDFVRVVDLKLNGHGLGQYCDEELLLDLRDPGNCLKAVEGMDEVYNLAANMGGIGFITMVGAEIMRDNLLINVNMLEAARIKEVEKFLFSSSACVYPDYRQNETNIPGLKEDDAYPASPDSFYGWEKLATEKICESYERDHGLEVRIARYHNIYGPYGTYKGGREKSPAALCRKVVEASNPGTITIWGDGKQTRSYCYIDDAVDATIMLMESDFSKPMNIGSNRLVTINEMADMIIHISGKKIAKQYDPSAPQGVRGRNADITIAKKVLGWEPKISLEAGLGRSYHWILGQCVEDQREVALAPRTD